MVDRYVRELTGEFDRPTLYLHLIETFDSIWEFYTEAKRLHSPARTCIQDATEAKARDGKDHDKIPTILEIVSEAIMATPELREVFTFAPEFDVAGDYVDMGRYMAGEPECMVYNPLQPRTTVSPIITLVSSADSNMGGHWETRGMIATALALALTRLGYATEMWSDNYGDGSFCGKMVYQYQRIKVKGTTDELNPARMLFGFGDSAMLTQLAFGCYDGFRKLGYEDWYRPFSTYGRGSACYRGEGVKSLYPEGTIFISGELNAGATPAQMAAVVVQELREAGLLKPPGSI